MNTCRRKRGASEREREREKREKERERERDIKPTDGTRRKGLCGQ